MAPAPTIGEQFGGYQLQDVLGRGGMGVVYRAEHMHLGRVVALKVLAPELSTNEDFRGRFLRESRLAAALDHPNVVTVYDAGDIDGALYLSMRLVKGEDLASVLARRGPLEPDEAIRMLEQVAGALDAAHAAGLVHRDVKPGNILVEGERCYLTDFGLTKPTTQDMTAMTATGVFLGTPDYAAPEQISGTQLDGHVDVYALGGVLHECLTGSRPFPRTPQVAVLYAHLHDPPPRPSDVRPGLPPGLDPVVGRALAKAPSERYGSCSELMAAARAALHGAAGGTTAVGGAGAVTRPAGAGADTVPRQPAPTPPGPASTPPPPAPQTGPAVTPPPAAAPADTRQVAGQPTAARPQTSPTASLPAESPTIAPPGTPGAPARRGRGPLIAIAAAAVVGLVVLAVVLMGGGGDDDDGSGNQGGAPGGQDPGAQQARVVGTPIPVGSRPFGVAVGEGVLWVANNDDNTVTRVGTDGQNPTDINVDDKPFGITRAGSSFWVANTGSDTVTRISVERGQAEPSIPVGDSPFFLAADESSVFVSNGGKNDGTITVLDARTGDPAGDPIQVGGELRGIAITESGVWVADRESDTVKRIVNGQVVKSIKVGNNPVSVAFGADALWVANKDSNTVSRISLADEGNEVKTIRVGKEPYGAAFGAGFAWITNSGDNTVWKLDPETGERVGDPIEVDDQPVGVGVGSDNQVWVTSNDAGTVTHIDPGAG